MLAGNGHEELLIDGETWRLNLLYRRRIGELWTVSVDVPWYRHSGGFLDDAVDAWHGLTNLPDGNRNRRGEDELLYLYKTGGQRRYLFDEASHGIGDVQFGLSRTFGAEGGTTLKATLKAPTGDRGTLTGSGATDLAFSILSRQPRMIGGAPAGIYWGVGAVRLGESDVFSLRSRNLGRIRRVRCRLAAAEAGRVQGAARCPFKLLFQCTGRAGVKRCPGQRWGLVEIGFRSNPDVCIQRGSDRQVSARLRHPYQSRLDLLSGSLGLCFAPHDAGIHGKPRPEMVPWARCETTR